MLEDHKGIKKNIIRIDEQSKAKIQDLIAREEQLSIFVNGKKLISLPCSPGHYEFLGAGFLFTTGILEKRDEIISLEIKQSSVNINIKNKNLPSVQFNQVSSIIEVEPQSKKISKTSIAKLENHKLNPLIIYKFIAAMQEKAVFFKLSGSVHSCALINENGEILLFSEDIGRYNTIDRIFGQVLLEGIDTSNKILVTSCRITSGIIKKIIFSNIPIIISRAAVTDCAIKIAHDNNITLIGFARGKRMNIYTHSIRIKI